MNNLTMIEKKEINILRKVGLVILVATIFVYLFLTIRFLFQF